MLTNNRLSTPPKGWNSFDCYGVFINEEQALRNLEVFNEKLRPFGYEYFCIDAGWYSEYDFQFDSGKPIQKDTAKLLIDEYGRFVASPRLFPCGLKYIADRVHEYGLKFVIHIMRGIPRIAVEQNTPIKGTKYYARDIANPDSICTWCPFLYGVDMNKPGSQEYYDSVIEYLAENGVDFIKADDIIMFPDEFKAVRRAINNCGRPMVLSLSPGNQAAKVNIEHFRCADMVRLSGDIWDERAALDTGLDRWNNWEDIDEPGLWLDLDMIPFGALQVYAKGNKNSDDNLLSGKGSARMCQFTLAEKQSFITMRALAASPLIMGGELTMTPDEDFALITNEYILDCCNNGVTGKQIFYQNYLDIRKTPQHGEQESGWLGVFNRSLSPKKITLTPEILKMAMGTKLFNIWDNKALDFAQGKLEVTIEPDGVCFIRYKNKKKR
ncbi:MAG: glycoside hydrolase family 27 protein [Victivallaceae bacterium]|nr:glycoside hydrolase family 27 protein [Victivallaceae bacterium]